MHGGRVCSDSETAHRSLGATSCPQVVARARGSTTEVRASRDPQMERMTGIEPALSAWEAGVLPLNYIRALGRRRTSERDVV